MNNKIVPARKLCNRDFVLLTITQLISILGNMVLTFALPLYILDISGSATLYGLILALSYIPLCVMSPVGGLIADRFQKQRIMFWLDVITVFIIILYILLSGIVGSLVFLIIVKLMALNSIQGMYSPAVQASVPLLAPSNKLVSANAIVNTIDSISSMAGYALAGILLAQFGLFPILVVSGICFIITAILDLFIRIPYKKQQSSGSSFKTTKEDILLAIQFMTKEKRIISKCAIVVALCVVTLMSMLLVSLPVLINQTLNLEMDYVGISQGIMMVGGIVGGILAGVLGNKMNIENLYLLFIASGVAILPIGFSLLLDISSSTAHTVITIASAISFIPLQMGTIIVFAFIQKEVSSDFVGKVMSFILMIPFLCLAIGQFIYGFLFEQFANYPSLIIFITTALSIGIARYAYKHLRL